MIKVLKITKVAKVIILPIGHGKRSSAQRCALEAWLKQRSGTLLIFQLPQDDWVTLSSPLCETVPPLPDTDEPGAVPEEYPDRDDGATTLRWRGR